MRPTSLMLSFAIATLAATSGLVLGGPAPKTRPAAADNGAEAAFRTAREYTVRIRTRIETPFVEDEQGSGSGAGFLVDSRRGWIVTNAHVVGHSPSEVEVAFCGESWQPARKLYVDSFMDVAILSVEEPQLGRRAASLDPSAMPNVGEPVGAFGHPLGVSFTGTRGIVSGYTDQFGPGMLQIDATVDPGNSGGPVIALRDGRILGMATARVESKEQKINLATPIRDVHAILELLRAGASACPPRMGFALLKDEDDRFTLRVGRTLDRSRWPFEPGDRIIGAAGVTDTLSNLSGLVRLLRGRTGPVSLLVERGGRRIEVVARPSLREDVLRRRGVLIDGALIGPVDYEDEPDNEDATRILVHFVESGSAAHSLDVQELDVLYTLDGRRFTELDSLVAHLERRPKERPLDLVLQRWAGDPHRACDYPIRTLPGAEVRVVGPAPAAAVAAH